MTIFTSTLPINDDPEPFVRTYNGVSPRRISAEYAQAGKATRFENGFGEVVVTRHDPRREFDRARAHEANPILVAIRAGWESEKDDEYIVRHALTIADYAADVVIYHADEWADQFTPEQIDHAHRVLGRFA